MYIKKKNTNYCYICNNKIDQDFSCRVKYCSLECIKKNKEKYKIPSQKITNTNYCGICSKKIDVNKYCNAKFCSKKCAQRNSTRNYVKKHGLIRNKWAKQIIVEFLGYKCNKCGNIESIEVDHIIPISIGGENKVSNIQLLCNICHKEKTSIENKNRYL